MRCSLRRSAARLLTLVLASSLLAPGSARAQTAQTFRFIRDAETEQLLRDYATPIFRAAGIREAVTKVVLIDDRAFNAFVADGKHIFINTGAIMEAGTPNEIIGVLAHESGHIVGGHLARSRQELLKAQLLAGLGTILGVGAAVGASGQKSQIGASGVGVGGLMLGGSELGRRSLLAYQRSEEQAADQAAVKFLNATGQSANGMLVTFQRFANDLLFKKGVDPYLQSHPLAPERIASLENVAHLSPSFDKKDAPALQARHDLVRAKLFGFTGRADEVARRYPASDGSLPARYARAIAAYRFGRIAEAQALIDELIRAQPANPYFSELKGQALLENGRAVEAVAPLRRAVQLSGGSPIIRILLGHALVATEQPRNLDEALSTLQQAVQRDPDATEGHRFLAQAYAGKGNEGMANLTTAQASYAAGAYDEAVRQAKRAQASLAPNSPGWIKAEDIIQSRIEPKTE